MNILLLMLTALHQNAVRQNQCAFRPDDNSTMPSPIFFRRSYAFNTTGGQSEIGKVKAYSPWNSELWFSLVGTNDVTIDKRSGALNVVTFLRRDFHTVQPQTFFAVVTDSHFNSATVTINVNVNTTGPTPSQGLALSSSSYTTDVYPDIARRAYVTSIRAISRDPSQQNQVKYYLSGSRSLRIDPNTGYVYVNELPLYIRTTVNVSASLGGITVSTNLVVNKICRPGVPTVNCFVNPCDVAPLCQTALTTTCVANYCGGCNAEFYSLGNRVNCSATTPPPTNDVPAFSSSQYRIKVPSNQTVNSVVAQVYALGPANQVITYHVVNSTYFRVDLVTGSLYLTKALANMTEHYFAVVAAFRSTPLRVSTAYVYVEVIAADALNLTFGLNWLRAVVTSNIGRGAYVTTVSAKASKNQDQVRYYIQGNNSIAVNERTGIVYVNQLPLYNRTKVEVIARLGNISTSVILDIFKVCLPNVPIIKCFADPCLTLACPEMRNATCMANYCGGCSADYYRSGDRVTCPGGTISPPVFSQTAYNVQVSANAPVNSAVTQVFATGIFNGTVVYSIPNTSYFWVNSSTGILYVSRPLGNTTSHNFRVTAAYRSSPALRSTAFVFINVVNRNSTLQGLTFANSTGSTDVYSDIARGAYVISIRAISIDPSQQNQVKHTLSGSRSLRIDSNTGAVYVNELPLYDRTTVYISAVLEVSGLRIETRTSLIVNKVCRPGVPVASCLGNPCDVAPVCQAAVTTTCLANYCGGCYAEFYALGNRVNCSVTPTPAPTNNVPIFSSPQYRIKVPSNQTVNSVVAQVYASTPASQVVIYSVVNSTYFTVDSVNGNLFLTRSLANMTEHYFAVTAAFRSSPQNVSMAYVYVEVIAADALKLTFGLTWQRAVVTSNIGRGAYVTSVRAIASRNQDQVRYYMQGNNSIAVNQTTGMVYVNQLPLYNRTKVEVIARLGNISTSVIVDIYKVCPANVPIVTCFADPCLTLACPEMRNATCMANYCGDCIAEYYRSGDRVTCPDPSRPTPVTQVNLPVYEAEVTEDMPIGGNVANMYNLGIVNLPLPSSSLSFVIDDAGDGTFGISDEGAIFLLKRLDYELKQRYNFIVNAIISTLTSVSTMPIRLTVRVMNVNDNFPVFLGVVSPFVVQSESNVGDALFKFLALDADVQDTVSYELIGGDATMFHVDSVSGELTLKRPMSENTYSLKVRATDSGTPGRSTIASLDITAVSQSQGYPWFPYYFGNFQVYESVPRNTLVKTIPAQSSQAVTYSKVPGTDPQGVFRVNSTTGDVYTDKLLDSESMSIAVFVMQASNQQNLLSTYVQVILSIADVNDNSPLFPFSQYDIDVLRSWEIGRRIFTADATDADIGSQPMGYSIASGNGGGVFAMNRNILVLARPLADVTATSFDLTIRASEGFFSATTRLIIRVQEDLVP